MNQGLLIAAGLGAMLLVGRAAQRGSDSRWAHMPVTRESYAALVAAAAQVRRQIRVGVNELRRDYGAWLRSMAELPLAPSWLPWDEGEFVPRDYRGLREYAGRVGVELPELRSFGAVNVVAQELNALARHLRDDAATRRGVALLYYREIA